MLSLLMIVAILIEIAIPIGVIILIILGIKALKRYLQAQQEEQIMYEEIERTTHEIDEIEKEIKNRKDT